MSSTSALSHQAFSSSFQTILSTSLIGRIFFWKTLSHLKIYLLSVLVLHLQTECNMALQRMEKETTQQMYSHSIENRNENGTFRRCDGFIYSNVKMFYNACMGLHVSFFLLCYFSCAVCTFFSFSLIQVCRLGLISKNQQTLLCISGMHLRLCVLCVYCTWTDDE